MLKFEITKEEHAALDDAKKELYTEHGDGFRLQVDGIDPADELKEALRKEREERAAAKRRAQELEDEKAKNERERLAKEQEWETLSKTERERADRLDRELKEVRTKAAEGDRQREAEGIVANLIDKNAKGGAQRFSLLRKEAMQYIAHTDGGIKINGPDGAAWDATKLGDFLKDQYPFLVDGSKASGGGAPGSTGGGAAGKKLSEMSDKERLEFKQRDPEGFRRAMNSNR